MARYAYHRRPSIREATDGRVLVAFSASSTFGSGFGSTCLYAKRDGRWGADSLRPSAAASIAAAEGWLVKRQWEPWA